MSKKLLCLLEMKEVLNFVKMGLLWGRKSFKLIGEAGKIVINSC